MSDNSFVGNNLYLKFGSTELHADYRSFSPSESVGSADGSSGPDSYSRELPTLTTWQATLEMVGPSGGTTAWAALAPKTEGTLEWGEEGTAAGKPKHTILAYIKGRDQTIPYADVVVWNITFGPRGDVTHSTY